MRFDRLGTRCLPGARDQLGVGERGHDHRYVHTMGGHLVGQCGRQAHHPELGPDVDDLAGHRNHAGQRRDVDDVTAPAGHHVGQRELAAGDDAVEVHLDRRADRLLGLLQERPDRHDAGVVDEHVDVAAAVGAGLVQERGEGLPIGDVQRISRHRPEDGEFGHRRFLQGHVPVPDDHARTALEQGLGRGVPDAPGGTGDRDRLSADVVHAAKLYTCQVWGQRGRVRSSERPAASRDHCAAGLPSTRKLEPSPPHGWGQPGGESSHGS